MTRPLILALVLVALVAAACGSAAPTTAPPAGPGAGTGTLPEVEGFDYRTAPGGSVSVFVDSATETLGDQVELEIVDALLATRGDDEVLAIAFGFPGTSDEQSVDYMARILDGLEDGFGAGSERGLGGLAYVIRAERQTIVIGPWGRTDHLVFLFALGPDQATRDLAAAILTPD